MPTEPRLRLHPRFTHLVHGGGLVTLVGEDDARSVEAPLARALLPALDGRRTAAEVVDGLRDRHPAAELHFLLLLLQREGIVVPVDDAGDPEAGPPALADAWSRVPAQGGALLPPGTPEASTDGWVLLCADYLDPRLAALRDRVPREAPVLLARPGVNTLWVGPGLADPDGACLRCLQDRLRLNLTARGLLHREVDQGEVEVLPLPAGPSPPTLAALSTALDAVGPLPDELRVVAPADPGPPASHPVPRLPQCPRCGDPDLTLPGADLRLRSRPAGRHSGGGFRIRPPGETLGEFQGRVSPLTGIVRHVRPIPIPGAPGVHVFTAGHAHHYGAGGLRALRDDLRDHSGGKGRTAEEARASALCEAMERFSAVRRGTEPVIRRRASKLDGTVLTPTALTGFSEAQYRERDAWNAASTGPFHHVPEPYDDQEIDWVRVRSPFSGDLAWAPASALYAGTSDPGARYVGADSNGLAGGNCLEEAVLQGLLEVVERDAVGIWWYNRVRRPGIDLGAAGDPWLDRMRQVHRDLGRSLHALDLTHDLGVPVAVAISSRTSADPEEIVFGFGAHLDPGIALGRAVTEVNQMLPAVLRDPPSRRRHLLPDYAEALAWWDEASLDAHPYLMPDPLADPGEADLALPTAGDGAPGDLLDHIRSLVDRLGTAGLGVWLHDLTRPDVGFPTVRVLVPGLRHFWRRLGPGRLYEVPPRLGWLPGPRSEHELNPVSLFV
ncbi:MAG TPA: TOMM precursor leader peptide-binding protein [Longimicrobiales bacterium]|nr:TOMM precursor leader peptide-binding protein [Longimicrobiales bacterium]